MHKQLQARIYVYAEVSSQCVVASGLSKTLEVSPSIKSRFYFFFFALDGNLYTDFSGCRTMFFYPGSRLMILLGFVKIRECCRCLN